MEYSQWLKMNINYEKLLLIRLKKQWGIKSDQYKKKLSQIEGLKNGN